MVRTGITNFNVLCVLLFLPLSQLIAQHVTLTADKTDFSVQEEVRITFTFENIRNAPRSINLDLHDSFSIVGGPYSSSNFSMVNGKTSYKNTVSYDLIAKKTGKILIPAYEFSIKNDVYRTEPLYVHVRKIPDSREADPDVDLPDIFIELHTNKDTVYQGETFTFVYRLYSTKSIVNYTTNPFSTIDGFIVDRFELNKDPSGSKEVIRGREYLTADIAFLTLTATKTGQLPVPLKIFRISTERSGKSRSFFDDPFFGISSERVKVASPLDTVMVLPLPAGAGPAFTGAIGDFAMHASLDTGRVHENQAIRLRVDLIGNGNMEHFTFPKPEFPEGFEIFEPKVKNAYELNKENYKGSRIWEYVLIPSKPGTFSFEDVRFTYFSPHRKDYRNLHVPLQKLRVLSHDELAGDYASTPVSR
ncbi:MAG: BatD family protein [Fidelibacterota bacterium]